MSKSFLSPVNPVRGVCEMVPASFFFFFLHRWDNQHFKRSLVMGLTPLGTDAEQGVQSRETPV